MTTAFKRLTLLGALVGAGWLVGACRSSEQGANQPASTERTAQTESQGKLEGRVNNEESTALGPSGPDNSTMSDQSGQPGTTPALQEEAKQGDNAEKTQHAETRRSDPRGDSELGTGGAGTGGAADAGTGMDGGSGRGK